MSQWLVKTLNSGLCQQENALKLLLIQLFQSVCDRLHLMHMPVQGFKQVMESSSCHQMSHTDKEAHFSVKHAKSEYS
jgi:hypothetical protein